MAMKVGLALNCSIQRLNVFARKNYFYPDLPKAYQISQYEMPIAMNGWLDVWAEGEEGREDLRRVRIRRVHLEEDTGKLTHLGNGDGSQVDFNRSGVPLLEIVTEPDMRSVDQARNFAMKVRQILRYLDVNSGDMEKGVIRYEANVSVKPKGEPSLGTRTEIKNLNSFRSLTEAIAFEEDRQVDLIRAGEAVVQDTMGWSETLQATFSQRGKEEAHDYRYFPEPDLPPLNISDAWVEEVKDQLVELPDQKVSRYIKEMGLSRYEANVLTEERSVALWFERAVLAGGDAQTIAKWMINTLFSLINETRQAIEAISVTPEGLVFLVDLVNDGTINNNTAKDVLAEMFSSGKSAKKIVVERGLDQISDAHTIENLISRILEDNPEQVNAYIAGKRQLRGWFIGQVMRATKGKANPSLVNKLLVKQLDSISDQHTKG
jgi:aspartyl-tRNA(Asn)/glutamyl-tRNA(Gln) amidotransferase subunit B